MKKTFTWFAVVIIIATVYCFAAAEKIDKSEITDFVLAWEETFEKELNGEMFPNSKIVRTPEENDMTQVDALVCAIEEILLRRNELTLTYFEDHVPFANFTSEGIWAISILPADVINKPVWGFFLTIDAKTSEIIMYKEVSPSNPPERNMTDEPKG